MTLNYLGIYNVSTNVPLLTDGIGTLGDAYIVTTTPGLFLVNRNLGSGLKTFGAYSYIFFDGAVWKSTLNI